MAKKVTFGVAYQMYAQQEVELPDDINAEDEEEVKAYVENIFPDLPLPDGDFIPESDEIDWECFYIK